MIRSKGMDCKRVVGLFALCAALATGANAAEKVKQSNGKALAATIDRQVGKLLSQEGMPPSPKCSDSEFLRRAYLDILGVIPTAEEAKKFLDSKDADKRSKLIDQLLDDPRYGKHFSDIWQDKLITETSDIRRLNKQPLVDWLTEQFNKNTPWNEFVHNLVSATGTQKDNGAVTYFLGNSSIDRLTDNVTRHFLGVQLQCAQCHHHPFVNWKQEEYWGIAMFFQKVRLDNVNRAAQGGDSAGVTEVAVTNTRGRGRQRGFRLPISAKRVPPKFLQGEQPKLDGSKPYRPILAKWLTSAENPYFAKAMVNRTWAHFFGRGLVNPIDDMHAENKPTHPELMKELTEGFVAGGFDVKDLIRTICNSETYQRSSKPVEQNLDAEPVLYARMNVKVLRAGQLYDSLQQVLSQGRVATNDRQAARGQQRNRNRGNPRDQFIDFFKRDPGAASDEYVSGIPQALRLINAREYSQFGLVSKLIRENKEQKEILETLYLSTLSRRPTGQELEFLSTKISNPRDAAGYNDVLWALLNCSEFTLNH